MAPRFGFKDAPRSQSRSNGASASSASSILAEARRLKQYAERKAEGEAKLGALEQSAHQFQNALTLSLSLPSQEEALFDLGEVYLLWSGVLQTRVGSPFKGKFSKPQALEAQYQASIAAANLSRQSFEMYERVCVLQGGGELKEEARVNSGNALCDWASLARGIPEDKGGGIAVAAELYKQADERYVGALASTPDDVEILTDMGDCCVQRAELATILVQQSGEPSCPHESWGRAKVLFEQGLSAYAAACANADARIGDDVAGLLQNWGAGLSSLAERTPDVEEAKELFRGAQEKLRSAIKFRPTDASLAIALGESLSSQVERFLSEPMFQQQALKLLETAVNEGFDAAMKIDSTNVEALLGLGDTHLTAGKILFRSGNPSNARAHWVRSADAYLRAVKLLAEDTESRYTLKFEEQSDALFNLACAAALASHEDDAAKALHQLAQVDAISARDLVDDPDLECLRTRDWFVQLIESRNRNP